MPVRYDIYDSPSSEEDEEKNGIHVRVVSSGLVTTETLAQKIQRESSLTVGDIESVLASLSYHMVDLLAQGNRVHIKGLGYFRMVITHSPPETGSEIKGGHVQFKAIKFLPEKQVKDQLKETRFLRSDRKNIHSRQYTDEEITSLLSEYFKTNPYITRSEFQKLLGMTKSTALSRINRLIKTGKLRKGGIFRFPVYEEVKDEE